MSKKKSTKPHKAGAKKRKKGGLKGAAKLKAATKGMAEQIAKPAGVLAGLVLSSVGSKILDKVPFLAPSATDDGKMSIKKFAKPAILLVAGGTIAFLTNKKPGAAMQFANGVGYGIAGGGVLSAVKVVTGKSLVAGLGEPSNEKAALEATYYKEQASDMAKMLEEQKFQPQLNAPVEEMGKPAWGATQDVDASGMIV